MPVTVLQARSRGPCSWCCKKLRLLKFRIDQNGDDEVVIRLRSRIEEISPDHLFLILPPRHISEFFRIDSTIGEGGFGTVFKAKPTPEGCKLVRRFQANKPYAIKMVKLQKKAGLAEEIGYSLLNVSMERHREFLLGLTSSGPFENGMIGLLAAFIHPKEALYQVMELLEGPDLFDFLAERSSKLEEVKAVGLVRQMVKAVHYMHRSLGALHRDIKPENFGFIQPPVPGQPLPALKLFDVGLAWVLKSPVTEETAKDLLHIKRCGTACYMAPEVWDGNTGPPSDVWSLGVVSYIVTSLEVPFKLMESKSPKLAVRENDLCFDSPAWTNTSQCAKDFLEAMLNKDWSNRPTTAEALAHEWLRPALQSEPELLPSISEGSSSSELTDKSLPLVAALPTKTRRSEAGLFESMTVMPEKFFAETAVADV
mmetsp:Transcript_38001/g.81718  ORF Transcript_38001/g.81718 Transcript_38001/m.81718 type:complete len:425 (+) Transcript_38001:50-1324(+)